MHITSPMSIILHEMGIMAFSLLKTFARPVTRYGVGKGKGVPYPMRSVGGVLISLS